MGSPLDDNIITLVMGLRGLKRLFSQDGIDAAEQTVLDELTSATNNISAFRRREVAVAQWVKTGEVTDYTVRNFRDAGAEITDLATERRRRRGTSNIVKFPTPSDSGPRAA